MYNILYSYNANGQLTTNYFYDDSNLVAERRTTDNTSSWLYYLYGVDGIAGFRYNSTTYLFRKNIQGDVTHIYTESGTLVGQYAYDAWGNCAILQDTNGIATLNPFRYRSYYYDTETNLYYLQSRYYDPETCRFVNADDISYLDPEIIGGLNLYAYCGNNPVMAVDPTGNFPILAFILGICALVGMGLTIAGVTSGNHTLTAIGLTFVAVPAFISGGMAVAAGLAGATFTGIVGGITITAGIGSALFASAEYQQTFTENNWMLDAGMSEGLYKGLMLTTAIIATLGTFASSFSYTFKIKSIDKIGKLVPSNHPNEGYWGIRFKNIRNSLQSLEIQNHVPHGLHFQLNNWNPLRMSVRTLRRWTWFLTKL